MRYVDGLVVIALIFAATANVKHLIFADVHLNLTSPVLAGENDNMQTLEEYFMMGPPSFVAEGYNRETIEDLQRFQNYFDTIRDNWVEQPTDQELIDAAIEGMIKSLDRHSSFLTPKGVEEMREKTSGGFSGVGMEVTKDEETGYVTVISPIDDTPAFRAGIEPGDLVIEVDGKNTNVDDEGKEIDLQTAVGWIRGPTGSTVKLKIIRDGVELPNTVDIVRDRIQVVNVKSQLLDGDIAHIRVASFNDTVSEDVRKHINKLKMTLQETDINALLQGLVLDLRRNPGGLLDEAIELSDLFVSEGNIVHTKGRDGTIHRSHDAGQRLFVRPSLPIVVLIDAGSASASEIVAATLLDLNRATLVGINSYGKGSVQTIYPMDAGYGLRLTTQYYYTASERKIHGVGIEPNVVIALPDGFKKERWSDMDLQMEAAIQIIRTGYDENCNWSVVEDGPPDVYGVTKTCVSENLTPKN